MKYLIACLFLIVSSFGNGFARGASSRGDTLLFKPNVILYFSVSFPFSFWMSGDLCLTENCLIVTPKVYSKKQAYIHSDSFKTVNLPYSNILVVRRNRWFYGPLIIKVITNDHVKKRYLLLAGPTKKKEIIRIIKSKIAARQTGH